MFIHNILRLGLPVSMIVVFILSTFSLFFNADMLFHSKVVKPVNGNKYGKKLGGMLFSPLFSLLYFFLFNLFLISFCTLRRKNNI